MIYIICLLHIHVTARLVDIPMEVHYKGYRVAQKNVYTLYSSISLE